MIPQLLQMPNPLGPRLDGEVIPAKTYTPAPKPKPKRGPHVADIIHVWTAGDPASQARQGYITDAADPYAALKAAHAEGKAIQFRYFNGEWLDCGEVEFWLSPHDYRIKPI